MSDRFGISVVIPTFNRRDPLLRAVNSVRSANPECVEIVVVDDASELNPSTFLPARTEQGIPIRSYRLDRNRGPQAARNLGIRRARYSYVAFLDSDDTFSEDKLDVVMRELRATPADVLFHGVSGMERYDRLARLWSNRLARLIPFRWMIALYNPAATPALVIRRRRRLGNPMLRHCEDYFFLLRYCVPGVEVRYLDAQLTSVHRPAGSQGGLSGSTWRMRKGEFVARGALLRERSASGVFRYLVGFGAGTARVVADLVRGRYLR